MACLAARNNESLVGSLATRWLVKIVKLEEIITYRKVASSSMSRLVAHFQIFRRLMKGKFDAYVL